MIRRPITGPHFPHINLVVCNAAAAAVCIVNFGAAHVRVYRVIEM